MKSLFRVIFLFLFLIQVQCRAILEIVNGKFIPYSGTAKNWQCITAKIDEENFNLDQFQKLFCILDFPISFAFDTAFLIFTIPMTLKSDDKEN